MCCLGQLITPSMYQRDIVSLKTSDKPVGLNRICSGNITKVLNPTAYKRLLLIVNVI